MATSLKEFMRQRGVSIPSSGRMMAPPSISQITSKKQLAPQEQLYKNIKAGAGSTLRWLGKQLMKPVSTVATLSEQVGKTIGGEGPRALAQIPSKIGKIWTGEIERSFTDIWREQLPKHQIAGTIIGLTFDIAADPLNFVGGMSPRVIAGLKKFVPRVPLYKGAKALFSTKTESKTFNAFIDEMKSLGEYRKVQVLEDARDIQKTVSKLPEKDIIRVSNYIEKNIKSTPEINRLGEKLKLTYKNWKEIERGMGIKGGEVFQYVPHIKPKQTIAQGVRGVISPSRRWTTKLGGAEKGRKILKYVADDGTELIGKAENLGLKSTKEGLKNAAGKIFRPQQASIDEISKAFGKHFFEENPAIQMAYRGLAHAKVTTSKQFFGGVKRFAVKDGIETAVPELKGLKFSDEIAKQIDNYHKAIQPEELKVVFKTYDAMLNWWKGQALIAPSYHIRNVVSNIWNNFLAGVTNPVDYVQAGMLQFGKAKNFRIAGMSGDDLLKTAEKRGVLGRGWYAADIPEAVTSGINRSWKKGINPISQQNYAFRLNKGIGSALENNARLAHFINILKKGRSVDDAVLSVKKYLFDYQDLTQFEKTVMKRVMPFYTWTRKNIPLQLEHLITQPGKYAGLEKVVRGIESVGMGDAKPANEKYLSDYIKNNTAMRVKYNEKDKTYYYFLLGNWLPSYQAIDFLSEPLHNMMSMLTPIIKTPLELLANKSSFFRDTLGEYSAIERYPGETTNYLGFSMSKKAATILRNIRLLNELDKLNPGKIFGGKAGEPSIFKEMPPIKFPGLGTLTPSKYKYGKTTPAPTAGERGLQMLFGKFQAYKESQAREYYRWDTERRIQELQRAIKNATRKGDRERARVLKQQLKEFKKKRGR